MIKIVDFSKVQGNNLPYGGNAGLKKGFTWNGENWFLKFPKSTKGFRDMEISYTTSPLSEFIGSQIYEMLDIPVHSTKLGVYENKVVFADEMDRVLNPILSDRVIAYINGMEHRGQFVFSTHNVLHLNLKTYMKEQIYFITKSKDELTSELYSLADFPEVRYENTKIYEFYMKGILGGTAFE